ncbi:TPA: hypothetical protein ACGUTZ_004427 [Vibrio vulnificus]
MKVYKLLTVILISLLSFSSFAVDCEQEKEFSLPTPHWLRSVEPELQYYIIYHLSTKVVNDCLSEVPSDKSKDIRNKIELAIGKDKLLNLEDNFQHLFDTSNAFKVLGLDIYDEEFLEKLRSYNFSSTSIEKKT